jgi:hypothetical protein
MKSTTVEYSTQLAGLIMSPKMSSLPRDAHYPPSRLFTCVNLGTSLRESSEFLLSPTCEFLLPSVSGVSLSLLQECASTEHTALQKQCPSASTLLLCEGTIRGHHL